MRHVLSISLPLQTTKDIKKNAKQKGFVSVSSYIKYLFETDTNLISKEELLEDVRIAEMEYTRGKTVNANSIAELL
ncbi:MAG: hypothetical protein HYV41_04665 [Candidatus Magasanikbacteria bacterium]|nr:hypothetical protein [Candidatus Magasanikbacteria bacterium]